jgi:hypothetical protein
MLVKARGQIETPNGTSDNVIKAHDLQAELDRSPVWRPSGVAARRTFPPTWRIFPNGPMWGPRVDELGCGSVIGVRLGTDRRRYGSLKAYST